MEPIVVRLSDSVTLINADCRDVPPLECDAVVTDPPYFRVKGEAWDRQWDNASAFLDFIGERVQAWHRDLRPNGSLYCFASPKMAARVECKIGERFNVLNHIVWPKSDMPTHALKYGADRFRQYVQKSERIIFAEHYGTENIGMGEDGYNDKDDEARGCVGETLRAYLAGERDRAGWTTRRVAEEYQKKTGSRTVTGMARHWFRRAQWAFPTAENYQWLRDLFNRNGGEYLRREYEDLRRPFSVTAAVPYTDVWTFPTVQAYEGKHPCEKPLALLEHIITASTRPGATVRDDFMGGGSTGVACIRTGRKFIGVEKDASYFELARQRLENELRQGRLPLTYSNSIA
jgi:site-specific DNA-methyltransferase (adenine-specific)